MQRVDATQLLISHYFPRQLFLRLTRREYMNERVRHVTFVGFVALLAIFTVACPDRRSIAELNANPSKYNGKEVVIAGTVRDSYGISLPGTSVAGGAYRIDDGTGSIWVIVRDGVVPTRGSRIGVKGTLNTGVNFQGRSYGTAMYEKDRRYDRK